MPQFSTITYRALATQAQRIMVRLREHGLVVPPEAWLSDSVKFVENLADAYEGHQRGESWPPWSYDALWRSVEIQPVIQAIGWALDRQDALPKLRQVVERDLGLMNPARTDDGKDILAELIVAERCNAGGLSVRLGEPGDVFVQVNDQEYDLECKRPQTVDGVASASKKARQQIRRSGRPGLVVLILDQVLRTRNQVLPGTVAQIGAFLTNWLLGFWGEHRADIEGRHPGDHVVGTLLFASAPAMAETDRSIVSGAMQCVGQIFHQAAAEHRARLMGRLAEALGGAGPIIRQEATR